MITQQHICIYVCVWSVEKKGGLKKLWRRNRAREKDKKDVDDGTYYILFYETRKRERRGWSLEFIPSLQQI